MKTIFLIPSSQGAAISKSPIQNTRTIIRTGALGLVKVSRPPPEHARTKPACTVPIIPADRSHSAILFTVIFAAAAAMIYLSAAAMLEIQGAAISESRTPKPPRSGAHFEGAR